MHKILFNYLPKPGYRSGHIMRKDASDYIKANELKEYILGELGEPPAQERFVYMNKIVLYSLLFMHFDTEEACQMWSDKIYGGDTSVIRHTSMKNFI